MENTEQNILTRVREVLGEDKAWALYFKMTEVSDWKYQHRMSDDEEEETLDEMIDRYAKEMKEKV